MHSYFIPKKFPEENKMNLFKILGILITGIAIALFISILLSLPMMLLWNGCLVPAVDGVHEIGWLQAWGLGFLFSMLFKNSTIVNKD